MSYGLAILCLFVYCGPLQSQEAQQFYIRQYTNFHRSVTGAEWWNWNGEASKKFKDFIDSRNEEVPAEVFIATTYQHDGSDMPIKSLLGLIAYVPYFEKVSHQQPKRFLHWSDRKFHVKIEFLKVSHLLASDVQVRVKEALVEETIRGVKTRYEKWLNNVVIPRQRKGQVALRVAVSSVFYDACGDSGEGIGDFCWNSLSAKLQVVSMQPGASIAGYEVERATQEYYCEAPKCGTLVEGAAHRADGSSKTTKTGRKRTCTKPKPSEPQQSVWWRRHWKPISFSLAALVGLGIALKWYRSIRPAK